MLAYLRGAKLYTDELLEKVYSDFFEFREKLEVDIPEGLNGRKQLLLDVDGAMFVFRRTILDLIIKNHDPGDIVEGRFGKEAANELNRRLQTQISQDLHVV